ncbi:DHA2 family lincomycin resistance protein-like MFS transporter [Sediminihabitans luteus]|uniref:DHA2 family lincomycin resistance protein-like MFS transporter n=1 Tax=Sediminihabitans luteus TaxID=1138585 RepID=A0A2M9D1Q0_9CELL|nr:MDR family MFS transporter [Sediminihabitans luteus]PJJ77983.1 DHA2 family lincomycin resistance protein-like MFS transporter [Sediminihabitans luteus]GIJ00614.1 MFS transporter [Sediminihabitans luteus]
MTAPATSPPPERLARQDVVVIGLLLAASCVVILNETTMGVALPALLDEFDIPASTGQWLTTAFMLTMAVVIPATGFLIGRLGTRRSFVLAMALFSAGTALAAVAPTFALLLGARVVQATGTAVMMPLMMTTIMTLVPPAMRGKVMGNVAIVMSAAPALGPTFAGIVLDSLSWRWIFGLVLPIALATLAVGAVYVKDTAERTTARLDPISLLLSAVAFGGLVYGLSSMGEAAREQPLVPVAVPVVVGAVVLGLFVLRQLRLQRTDTALLDLRVFTSGGFTVALSIMVVSMVALFGTIILLPLYLQDVLGLDALHTGLLVLPGGLLMGLLGPTVGSLYDRVGPRPLVVPGTAAVATAMGALATVGATTSPWFVLAAHLVLSLGLAFVFTPLFTAALGALPPHLYAHGSATIATVQQLAGAAGTALFVAVLTTRSLAGGDAPGAVEVADGVGAAFTWGAAISVVAIGLSVLLRRPAPEPADASGKSAGPESAGIQSAHPEVVADAVAQPAPPAHEAAKAAAPTD